MKSLIESIRIQLHERLSSPLFGTFVVAWIVWNHQYLLILFASAPIEVRLTLAKSEVFPTVESGILRGGVYPLVSSLLFILIYPYPAKWIYGYWLKRQREVKAVRDKIEDETLLTVEDSRQIRLKILNAKTEYEERFRALSDENDLLKKQNSELTKVRTAELARQTYSAGVLELIKLLAKTTTVPRTHSMLEQLGGSPVAAQAHLTQALADGLVKEAKGPIGQATLELTETGRLLAEAEGYIFNRNLKSTGDSRVPLA